ncbi:hypothetical protein L6452_20732 [Arctium lappa]|uniref:Uncharacterized protein n=1 Tax=Arctium lappa TaxID=4217 RepID=A0ACB9BBE1_ARCLA|nr:hypothetical protein L6452_20732 [Arctium lappa]
MLLILITVFDNIITDLRQGIILNNLTHGGGIRRRCCDVNDGHAGDVVCGEYNGGNVRPPTDDTRPLTVSGSVKDEGGGAGVPIKALRLSERLRRKAVRDPSEEIKVLKYENTDEV